ncbi:MAG: carboxypeptidase regulatory-like domain-containing protein [bacterium]
MALFFTHWNGKAKGERRNNRSCKINRYALFRTFALATTLFIVLVGMRGENIDLSGKEPPVFSNDQVIFSENGVNDGKTAPDRDRRGGPDRFGYRWVDSDEQGGGVRYEWIDIRNLQGVQQLQGGDDINVGPYELGFQFPWYGQMYDRVRLCSNGWITFNPNENVNTIYLPQCPNAGNPNNILVPLNYDLNPGAGGAWYFWTNRRDRAIISWVDVPRFANNNIRATFQVIINANGIVYYQYQSLQNLNHGEVNIGWENPDGQDGHSISYRQEFAHNELAVRIAKPMGVVRGRVTDLATREPIEGAQVGIVNGPVTQTDAQGYYIIGDILTGRYVLEAWAQFYNRVRSDTVAVADRETTVVNFTLPHPEIRIDAQGFEVELPRNGVDRRSFHIFNDGNGPLDFTTKFSIPVRDEPGDVVFELNATDITGDRNLRGVATDGSRIFLTGSNNNAEPNYIYILEEGELVGRFEQPQENPSNIGLKGLAFDGTFLYSADGRIINKIDLEGNLVGTINSPVNPTRYITYNPENDHFWVCEITSPLYEIDREGNVVRQFNKPQRAYGLAWHPGDLDGFNLYIFHRIPNGSQLALAKMDPENGEIQEVMEFTFQDRDVATDCDLTNLYNPLVWLFVALVDNQGVDRVVAAELELNTSWVQVTPRQGTVAPEDSLEIRLRFDALGWEPGRYELDLVIEHNARGGNIHLPLSLTVTDEVIEPEFYQYAVTNIRHQINITEVQLRGAPAEFGDEIGVFTPASVCAGGALWLDRITPVTAYGDDPETEEVEGFRENEAFAFRVWDRSINRDFPADFHYFTGDERFRSGGDTRGWLEVPGLVRSLTWEMTPGWHLISMNLFPDRESIPEIMTRLVENRSLVLVKDGQGRFYNPLSGFNNIPRWDPIQGYWIKVRTSDRLEITGESLEPGTPIDLRAGWNLVAYIPRRPMRPQTAFEPLGNNLIVAKDGKGRFYLPSYGYSNLPVCEEGAGYSLKVREAAQFRYPLAGLASQIPVEQPQTLKWINEVSPTGINMTALWEVPEAEPGWEVAVRNKEGMLVGSGVIDKSHRVGVAIWGDDPLTDEKEGLQEGEVFFVEIWKSTNDKVTGKLLIRDGGESFESDGIIYGELLLTDKILPEKVELSSVYPNPFNLQSRFSIGLPEKGFVSLMVFDLTGRQIEEVFRGELSAGYHTFTLNASQFPTGTYLLTLQAPHSDRKVVKMIVMK